MKVTIGKGMDVRELYIDFYRKKRKGSIETICKIVEGRGDLSKVVTKGKSKNFAGGDVSRDSDVEKILPKDPFNKEIGRRKALHRALIGVVRCNTDTQIVGVFSRQHRLEIVKQYEEFIEQSRKAGSYDKEKEDKEQHLLDEHNDEAEQKELAKSGSEEDIPF